jgi:hypothetical protein
MKEYRVALTEAELKAVIRHHSESMCLGDIDADTSKRIHDLTKRLKNDGPEISNDPRPEISLTPDSTFTNEIKGWA